MVICIQCVIQTLDSKALYLSLLKPTLPCRDGTPTPALQQRVEAGVDLFDKVRLAGYASPGYLARSWPECNITSGVQGRVDHLIFSGGHPGLNPVSSGGWDLSCA